MTKKYTTNINNMFFEGLDEVETAEINTVGDAFDAFAKIESLTEASIESKLDISEDDLEKAEQKGIGLQDGHFGNETPKD